MLMLVVVSFATMHLAGCKNESVDRVQSSAAKGSTSPLPPEGAIPGGALRQPENAMQLVGRAISQYGSSSPEAAMVYGIASAQCAPGAFPTKDAGPAAHRAAVAKIKEACSGFDQASLPKPSYAFKRYSPLGKNEAEIGALKQDALKTLRTSSAIQAEAISAAWFLIEQGEFPEQESYGVSDEKLAEAFGVAQSLKSCKITGCGPNDLMTLSICARTSCPPNSNYETALSQAYSPAQFRLIQQLRNKTF